MEIDSTKIIELSLRTEINSDFIHNIKDPSEQLQHMTRKMVLQLAEKLLPYVTIQQHTPDPAIPAIKIDVKLMCFDPSIREDIIKDNSSNHAKSKRVDPSAFSVIRGSTMGRNWWEQ